MERPRRDDVLDLEVAEAVQSTFFRDLEQAREIRLEEWRGRPRWHRVRVTPVPGADGRIARVASAGSIAAPAGAREPLTA